MNMVLEMTCLQYEYGFGNYMCLQYEYGYWERVVSTMADMSHQYEYG